MNKYIPHIYLTFLLILNIFNFVDRNLLMAFSNEIKSEFNLTNVEWGLLTGLYFLFFYSIFGIFMGLLGDKFNRIKIIAVGVFLWSIMTAFTGVAKNFYHLIVARAFIGIGESALSPNSISILSDLYKQNKRGTASAIYYLGIPLGVGFGFIVSAYFGPLYGWRNVFIFLGVLGAILSIFAFFLFEPKRGVMDVVQKNDDQSLSIGGILNLAKSILLKSRSLTLVIIGSIFLHIPLGAGNFEVLWAVQEREFTASSYNTIFGIFFIIGGSIGGILGGVLSDRFSKNFKGGSMTFLTVSYLILTPLVLGYRFASPDSLFFYFTLFFISMHVTYFYGPVFAAVQELTPFKVRTTMVAVFILGVNIIGMGFGSFATGFLSDYIFDTTATPYTYSLLTMGSSGFIAIICYYLSSFTYARDIELARRLTE